MFENKHFSFFNKGLYLWACSILTIYIYYMSLFFTTSGCKFLSAPSIPLRLVFPDLGHLKENFQIRIKECACNIKLHAHWLCFHLTDMTNWCIAVFQATTSSLEFFGSVYNAGTAVCFWDMQKHKVIVNFFFSNVWVM